jgi:hypothetical protein
MLTVHEGQMAALQRGMDEELFDDIKNFLRGCHPAAVATQPPGRLDALVRAAADRCAELGLTRRCAVGWYAAMMLVVAPDFESQPAIGAHLADPSVPPECRIESALEKTTPGDWDEARSYAEGGF